MSTTATGFTSDVTYGLRQIRKNLSLTLLCVLVLGIAIGSATAVFAVLYDVLLKPLPYRDAKQLVYVHNEFPTSQLGHTNVSAPDYTDLTAHREIFSETAAYYFNDLTMSSPDGSSYAEHIDAVNTSASLFSILGISPQLGRPILPDDDRYGAPKVVLLSDSLWKSHLGSDRGIVGKTIQLDSVPYLIIGVMPPDFNFPYPATQMWLPLVFGRKELSPDERGDKWLRMLARTAPAVTLDRANVMLRAVGHELAALYPDVYLDKTGWHFSAEAMLTEQTKDVRGWLVLAFGAVICVVLIACTNVSGLLLVCATIRNRELAVRAALGASSGRLVRQILTETSLLVALGCGVGLGLAIVLMRLINAYGPIHRAAIEPWALAFVFGLCITSTLIAGLLPAVLSSRVSLEQSLRVGAGRTTTGQTRWRGVLVAGQISIAVTLLFTANALSRSFIKLLEVSPGFLPDRVWTASVQLPEKTYSTNESSAVW
jgi:putative ABC transport system permease protein